LAHDRRPGLEQSAVEDQRAQVIYLHPAKQRVGFPFAKVILSSRLMPYLLMPAGLVGLANLLAGEGIVVRGINYPVECFIKPGFDLVAWLRSVGPPRVILVDLHWFEHSFGAMDIARVCKAVYPDTPLVVGGMTASYFAEQILAHSSSVDFIICGDAEEPLRQLVLQLCQRDTRAKDLESIPNLCYRRGNRVIKNGLGYQASSAELDDLDFINLDFLDHAQDYLGFEYVPVRGISTPSEELQGRWLTIGRGCSYNCSFCGGGNASHSILAGREGFVMRSVEAVVDDIEELQDRGIHQVSLTLDPAVVGKSYWKSLFSELSRRRIRIGLYNEAFQLPSEDFVEAFAECAIPRHSQFALSPLSGDEQVRRMNGKCFSNCELFAVLKALKRHRLPVGIYYSSNLPGQDETSLRKTLFVSERIASLYPSHLLAMYNLPHTLDPCSPMSCHPEDFDIEVQFHCFEDYVDYCQRTAVGVPRLGDRGFQWRKRTLDEQRKMQQLWRDFGNQQRFPCL